MAKKSDLYAHLGISWKRMKIGAMEYKGSRDGAKSNAARANRLYFPKQWRTFTKDGKIFVERLPDHKERLPDHKE